MLCMGIDPLLGYSSRWRSMRQGGDRALHDQGRGSQKAIALCNEADFCDRAAPPLLAAQRGRSGAAPCSAWGSTRSGCSSLWRSMRQSGDLGPALQGDLTQLHGTETVTVTVLLPASIGTGMSAGPALASMAITRCLGTKPWSLEFTDTSRRL